MFQHLQVSPTAYGEHCEEREKRQAAAEHTRESKQSATIRKEKENRDQANCFCTPS
jgi:hypothetical protein